MKINDSNMSTSELSSLTSSNASRVHLAHGEQNEHSNSHNSNSHSMSCNDFLLQSSLVNGANFQYMPKCPLCDKTFANSSNLKHHMNTIHFNEAKWICNECGKVCTSKSNLKVHLRVHLRVKPYYCRWCDYNCMHHSSIRDHLSKCHPEKSHNSSEPGYIFNSAAVPEPELSNYDLTLKNFESPECQNASVQLQETNNNKKTNINSIKTESSSYSSEDNVKVDSADLAKHEPNESTNTTNNKSKLIKHHENNIHHHHHHLNNCKSNLPINSNKKKKPNKIRKLEESFLLSYKKSHDAAATNKSLMLNGADNQNADFENSHSDSESSGCHHNHSQKDMCPIGNSINAPIPPAISSFLFSPSMAGFPSSAASDLLNNLLQNSNLFKQFTQSSSSNNLTANLIQRLNATAFMNQLNNNNSLSSISNQPVVPITTAVASASTNSNNGNMNNNLKTKHLEGNGLNALDLTISQEKKKLKLSNNEQGVVEESPVSPASSLSSSISASSSESSASASSMSSSRHFSPTSNSTNSTTSTLKTASKPNSKILNKSSKKAISDVINRLNLNLPNRIKKSHNTVTETSDQKCARRDDDDDNDDDEENEFSTSNGKTKHESSSTANNFYPSDEIKHENDENDDEDDDDDNDDETNEHFDNFKTSEKNDNNNNNEKHFIEMTSLSQRKQNSNDIDDDNHDENNENTSCSYKCKYCNIIFDEYSLYSIHAGMHSNTNPWKCNVCGHVCSNKVDFAVHILHLPKI